MEIKTDLMNACKKFHTISACLDDLAKEKKEIEKKEKDLIAKRSKHKSMIHNYFNCRDKPSAGQSLVVMISKINCVVLSRAENFGPITVSVGQMP